jgi:hypothetical protein
MLFPDMIRPPLTQQVTRSGAYFNMALIADPNVLVTMAG